MSRRLPGSSTPPSFPPSRWASRPSRPKILSITEDEDGTAAESAPTTDELVYWTYIYSNAGENNGKLEKYRGKRKLSDWITKGEYPNAIKLLESYRMVSEMAIFA